MDGCLAATVRPPHLWGNAADLSVGGTARSWRRGSPGAMARLLMGLNPSKRRRRGRRPRRHGGAHGRARTAGRHQPQQGRRRFHPREVGHASRLNRRSANLLPSGIHSSDAAMVAVPPTRAAETGDGPIRAAVGRLAQAHVRLASTTGRSARGLGRHPPPYYH